MHDGTVRDVCFIEDTSNKTSLLVSGGAGDCKIYVTDCATGKTFQVRQSAYSLTKKKHNQYQVAIATPCKIVSTFQKAAASRESGCVICSFEELKKNTRILHFGNLKHCVHRTIFCYQHAFVMIFSCPVSNVSLQSKCRIYSGPCDIEALYHMPFWLEYCCRKSVLQRNS